MRFELFACFLFVACVPSAEPDAGTDAGQTPAPPAQTFRAECELACRNEAARDGCIASIAGCIDGCVAMTTGLATACGECVVAQTYIYRDEMGCVTELGTIEFETCAEVCAGAPHAEPPEFAAECQNRCDAVHIDATCPSTCVDDCVAMTAGLGTTCGKCVASLTYSWTEDGVCGIEVGEVAAEDCATVCGEPVNRAPRADFRAECEVFCRQAGAAADCAVPGCVDDCVAVTAGLGATCGKCVGSLTYMGREPDGGCYAEIGFVGDEMCATYCNP